MSTVAEEITRISGCREDIKTAIAAKGVTVPTGAKLADCPALIASITGGGGGEVTSFVNTGFSATGAWTYSRPFTATQNSVPSYDTVTTITSLQTAGVTNNNYLGYTIPDTSIFPLNDAPASIVFTGTKQQWGSFTANGTVYGLTSQYGTSLISIGSWNATTAATSFTATANFTADVQSLPYYIGMQNLPTWMITAGTNITATTYVQTGTAYPYPQYAASTTGVMNGYISGKEDWQNYVAQEVRTGGWTATYDDGPTSASAQAGPFVNYVTAFTPGRLQTLVTGVSTGYTGKEDSGYTYTYGEITSAYNGYTGY